MGGYIGSRAVNLSTTAADVSGNATIGGNLTVSGTTVTIDSANAQTVDLGDNDKIRLGDGDDLQIYHDASHSYIVDAGTGNMYLSTNGNGIVMQASLSETMFAALPNGAVTLYHDNDPKISTSSTGIGVTGHIDLNTSGNRAKLGYDSNNVYIGSTSGTGEIHFKNNISSTDAPHSSGDTKMVITDTGVGIGTSSPAASTATHKNLQLGLGAVVTGRTDDTPLHLNSNLTFDGTNFDYIANTTATQIILDTNIRFLNAPSGTAGNAATVTERMRVDSSGNLLVGKTSASGSTVGAELRAAGTVIATVDGDYPLYLNRKTSDGEIAQLRKDGTQVGSIGVSSDGASIGNATQHVAMHSNKLVPATVTHSNLDNTISLGTGSARFKDLYLSGGVYFQGSTTANQFDGYEEGTWTPTLARWVGGNISATYTAQNGRYTKIGRMVTLSFDITVSSISSQGSSIAYINGAPFNNPSSQDYDYAGTFGIRTCIPEATIATSCIKHSTYTSILIRQNNDFDQNVDDNWQSGTMRGSITYEHG